jgi:hypothetical protein
VILVESVQHQVGLSVVIGVSHVEYKQHRSIYRWTVWTACMAALAAGRRCVSTISCSRPSFCSPWYAPSLM